MNFKDVVNEMHKKAFLKDLEYSEYEKDRQIYLREWDKLGFNYLIMITMFKGERVVFPRKYFLDVREERGIQDLRCYSISTLLNKK